jgi:hypothetical protein
LPTHFKKKNKKSVFEFLTPFIETPLGGLCSSVPCSWSFGSRLGIKNTGWSVLLVKNSVPQIPNFRSEFVWFYFVGRIILQEWSE